MPTIRGSAKSRMLVTPQIYSAPTITRVVREVNKLRDSVWAVSYTHLVGGNDGQIRQLAADLSHLKTTLSRTVASAAEQADQSVRFIFPQRGQDVYKRQAVHRAASHTAIRLPRSAFAVL